MEFSTQGQHKMKIEILLKFCATDKKKEPRKQLFYPMQQGEHVVATDSNIAIVTPRQDIKGKLPENNEQDFPNLTKIQKTCLPNKYRMHIPKISKDFIAIRENKKLLKFFNSKYINLIKEALGDRVTMRIDKDVQIVNEGVGQTGLQAKFTSTKNNSVIYLMPMNYSDESLEYLTQIKKQTVDIAVHEMT